MSFSGVAARNRSPCKNLPFLNKAPSMAIFERVSLVSCSHTSSVLHPGTPGSRSGAKVQEPSPRVTGTPLGAASPETYHPSRPLIDPLSMISESLNRIFAATLLLAAHSILFAPATARAQSGGVFAAVADSFDVVHDAVFSSSTVSVMDNDAGIPDDSVHTVITIPPAHGSATLTTSGTFNYTPDPGYIGPDSFTYVVQTLPVQTLEFSPASSNLEFEATLKISIGEDTARKTIPINGTVLFDIGSGTAPIDSVHVLGLSVRNDAVIELEFKYGGIVTIGRINIVAAREALLLDLTEVGPRVAAGGAFNSFTQTGNKLGVDATVTMSGSGVLNGQVPTTPQHLVTETDFDVVGSVLSQPGTLAFVLNIDSRNEFEIDGNPVNLNITGSAVATGPLKERQVSEPAIVALNVISPTSAEDDTLPATNRLLSIYPNPAAETATISYEIVRPGFVRFEVYDLLGRRRLEETVSTGTIGSRLQTLDLTALTPGLYFVRASQLDWNATRSIVVR
jgi:Bacterial Ig domain/Secretion system C-terminal sorting domain